MIKFLVFWGLVGFAVLVTLLWLTGCSTVPVVKQSLTPPMPPAPLLAPVAQIVPITNIWTPPILTLIWDGATCPNSFDTVQESPTLTPPSWYPVQTMATQTNQMQFQFTADQPQMWFRVERSQQPPG